MKKRSDVIRNWARELTDEDLRFVNIRLADRIGSDIYEVMQLMLRNKEVDYCYSVAKDASELFDIIDETEIIIQKEIKKRFE